VCYSAADANDMRNKVAHILDHIEALNESLMPPVVDDTIKEEITLLRNSFL
jgi:hypothetical protein